MPRALAALLDVAVVIVFVIIGRSTHDEQNVLAATLGTAAPFLIALALGWAVVLLRRQDPTAVGLQGGVVIWAFTWVGGLLLRSVVFHGGTAVGFVVVAGLALAVGLLGWRAIANLATRRNAESSSDA